MSRVNFKHIPTIVAITLLLISIIISFYFTLINPDQLTVTDLKESNIQREELQRYFGYDQDLLRSYLSVPYDISINTNQSGSFVDIGFIYIILAPIIFIGLLSQRIYQWVACALGFLLLTISISTSYIISNSNLISAEQLSDATVNGLADQFLRLIYRFLHAVYVPIDIAISFVSGPKDHISYPLLMLLFTGFMFIVVKGFSKYSTHSYALVSILSIYGFFFIVFSSGVIWYGFLFFILLLISILYFLSRGLSLELLPHRIFRYVFALSVLIWLFMGTMSRISSIQGEMPEQHKGKGIIHPDVFMYNTGLISSKSELLDQNIPGFSKAIEKINSDKSKKVYAVGTGLGYFVEDNHERLYSDNQLGTFYWIMKLYKHKFVISDVLKASGFKYLIIDINTHTVDHTPEQTLRNKFIGLLDYVTNNESVSMLCTDNMVVDPNTNENIFGIEGEIYRRGTFVIYEIN